MPLKVRREIGVGRDGFVGPDEDIVQGSGEHGRVESNQLAVLNKAVYQDLGLKKNFHLFPLLG